MPACKRDISNSVVYQVYVRSFCDSTGDGLGDLPGITSKLDYLAHLGVDYVWLTPFYPSPQRDNGYDVANYCAVDPRYGTMDDFDELVARAQELGIGVMLDMVLCHTSVEHEWFQRALEGDEYYQKFYILRDGRNVQSPGDCGEPPTNWQSAFGGSAWEWEPRLGKWYLHLHDVSQPDLDWSNPVVRHELANVVRFWRDKGVSGFRFDVINLISKPLVFEDDTQGLGRRLFSDGPHVHEYIHELVMAAGIEDMVTVGEMASTDLAHCVRYTKQEAQELSMTFSFHHLKVDYANGDKWSLSKPHIDRLRELFKGWQEGMQAGGGWNALFWDNHDQPRAVTRFGGTEGLGQPQSTWEHVAKMLAVCIHLMKGTPYIYQGDEIGMVNPGYASITDFDDVESQAAYRMLISNGAKPTEALQVINARSRDNGRTPMQWTAEPGAGFSSGRPWLAIPTTHKVINAQSQVGVASSVFELYRQLIELRHTSEVVAHGQVRFLDAGKQAAKVLAFERTLDDERLVIACSFDDSPCTIADLDIGGAEVVLATYDSDPQPEFLRPYEAVVWRCS